MLKSNVAIGKVYIAKVSGVQVRVRIDSESRHGGWNATNLATGRAIRIRTAARLHPAVDMLYSRKEADGNA